MSLELKSETANTEDSIGIFAANLAEKLREIVSSLAAMAVNGAIKSGDEDYCEVDYTDVDAALESLEEMGITLTYEQLSEFLDEHPEVNYVDAHNTGITFYLNAEEQTHSQTM